MPVAAPVEPLDPALVDACGEEPGGVCEQVWEWTGNETWAKLADWVIGIPLAIVIILVVAWILVHLARRAVRRAVDRVVVTDRRTAAWARQRVGPSGDRTEAPEDPRRSARAASISTVVASTVTVVIWVVALFLIIGELGIDLAPLIAGAGIAGIALGFGAQNLVKDCLSGLFMLIEDQYGIGDVVDLGEAAGVVERISLRTTVLRGVDGTVWHVPNGEILRVGNRSQLWSVAVVDVLIAYDADVEVATRVLEDTATELVQGEDHAADVLEPPEVLGVEAASADGVQLRLTVKTTPGAQFRLQRALRQAVKSAFDAADIAAPPPNPFRGP